MADQLLVDVADAGVHMVRDGMSDIPQFVLPAGYRFRMYRPGDAAAWTQIQRAADTFQEIRDDLFAHEFGANLAALPDRMFFVDTVEGETVGNITAWWTPPQAPPPGARGLIHWVAVRPDHQRRGLSKPMMTVAMQRLAQEYTSAQLGTYTGRVWAIKVYLDFGFHPMPDELAQPEILGAWRKLQSSLHHPQLEPWLDNP